jgi:cell division septum initiation protein DivIVA
MTTDQIKRTGGTVETDSDDATTEAAAVLEAAQADAKQILAKARYEAFRMVTDARSEAESILSEAELTAPVAVSGEVDTAEAEEAAELIVTAAEEKAAGIIKEAEVQATRLYETSRASVEQQTAVLRERHERLEAQVASTQALLTDLEKRLAQIAAPSAPNPTPRTTPPAYSLAGETEPTNAKPVQRLNSADGSDPLPPAASGDHDRPVSMIPASATVTAAPAEQGSFYTRRSANLPSIGSAGGQDAMSAVRSMRSKMEHDGR